MDYSHAYLSSFGFLKKLPVITRHHLHMTICLKLYDHSSLPDMSIIFRQLFWLIQIDKRLYWIGSSISTIPKVWEASESNHLKGLLTDSQASSQTFWFRRSGLKPDDLLMLLVQRPRWVWHTLRNKNKRDDTELMTTHKKELILNIFRIPHRIMADNLNFLQLQNRGWQMMPKRSEGFSSDQNLYSKSQTKNSIWHRLPYQENACIVQRERAFQLTFMWVLAWGLYRNRNHKLQTATEWTAWMMAKVNF